MEDSTAEEFNPSNWGMSLAAGIPREGDDDAEDMVKESKDEVVDDLSNTSDPVDSETGLGVGQESLEEDQAYSLEYLSATSSFPSKRKGWKQERCKKIGVLRQDFERSQRPGQRMVEYKLLWH